MVAACGTPKVASVGGGEAHALTAPPCLVKSTSTEGQLWVDETTEVGVGVLDWQRPQRQCQGEQRLAALPPPAQALPPPAKKKKRWRDKLRGLIRN